MYRAYATVAIQVILLLMSGIATCSSGSGSGGCSGGQSPQTRSALAAAAAALRADNVPLALSIALDTWRNGSCEGKTLQNITGML
jgi:hypothetical protein